MSMYANGADVLPPELYEEVRKHWNGGFLWIRTKTPKKKLPDPNDEHAYVLMRAGLSARDIAASCDMTLNHVRYLVQKLRRKQKSSPPAAENPASAVTENVTEE